MHGWKQIPSATRGTQRFEGDGLRGVCILQLPWRRTSIVKCFVGLQWILASNLKGQKNATYYSIEVSSIDMKLFNSKPYQISAADPLSSAGNEGLEELTGYVVDSYIPLENSPTSTHFTCFQPSMPRCCQ
jgi:hypothetical protein